MKNKTIFRNLFYALKYNYLRDHLSHSYHWRSQNA